MLRSLVAGVPVSTAGCAGPFGGDTQTGSPESAAPGVPPTDRQNATGAPDEQTPTGTSDGDPLRVGVSPLLAGPVARAAALWNGSRLPTDDEYGTTLADELGSDGPGFAGYFAARHGFTPTETAHHPPFPVAVGEGDDDEIYAALTSGTLDLVAPRAEVFDTIGSEFDASGLVRHDLFRTGQAFVVSTAVHDAGVTSVGRDELLGVYNGRITNWRTVGGPDRDIHLIGTVNDAHPETLDRTFLRDQPQGGADQLYGQVRRKVAAVADRDDTLTRVPLRDVGSLRDGGTDDYRILDVAVNGDPRGPGSAGYPGTYPLPLFTTGEPDRRERAVLDMLSADAVQPAILNEDGGRLAVLPATTGTDR
jgi:phosphate transport system substrate-binding protein